MDKDFYLDAVRRDSRALRDEASRGLDAPVPSCPGWSVASLVGHTGHVYSAVGANVRGRVSQPALRSSADLPRIVESPTIGAWLQSDMAGPVPDGLLDWFDARAAALLEALAGAEPEERVWTWFAPDQTAGFWQRRMAHETAVHRWDAELAHGNPKPIEQELASDGVDEALAVIAVDRFADAGSHGAGETYHFHQTDGPGEWVVELGPDRATVRREHAKADVAVRGPASDLVLFLWHRIPADDRLEVHGDRALLDRWFELIPPE